MLYSLGKKTEFHFRRDIKKYELLDRPVAKKSFRHQSEFM